MLLRTELGVGRVRVAARTLAVGALSVELLGGIANLGAGLGEGQSSGGEEGGDSEDLHCDGWFDKSVGQTFGKLRKLRLAKQCRESWFELL